MRYLTPSIAIACFVSWGFSTLSLAEEQAPASLMSCTTTREYITSLEFLRSHADFGIPEEEARRIALKASRGCTGAAQRFIKVTGTLSKAGLTSPNAIQTGLEFALRTDIDAEAFVSVFLRAFTKDSLDLDLQSSLILAHSLMSEFRGDILAVLNDFETLLKFCIQSKGLGLPLPTCAGFASRIAHKSEKFSGGVASSFISVFQFLVSNSGPQLTTQQALSTSEMLVDAGRDGADNFIGAYKYAVSPKGLGMTSREAVHFATSMALPNEGSPDPLPAPAPESPIVTSSSPPEL